MAQVKDSKGKLVTIGHVYEFNDEGGGEATWRVHTLHSVKPDISHQYRVGTAGSLGYSHIREMQATIGKVENPPVELIDGEVYSFTEQAWDNRARLVGFYKKSMDAFYVNTFPSPNSFHIKGAREVTDIVLLKPSV